MTPTAHIFKHIRSELKLTQAQLGERIGEKRQAITNWENGREIGFDKLSGILKMLKFDFLLCETK